jgi:hypothetical protein
MDNKQSPAPTPSSQFRQGLVSRLNNPASSEGGYFVPGSFRDTLVATTGAWLDEMFLARFFPTSLALLCTYDSLLDARR